MMACSILQPLMKIHGRSFDEESLVTFMTETKAILNSRPLTTDNINDPTSTLSSSPSKTFKNEVKSDNTTTK